MSLQREAILQRIRDLLLNATGADDRIFINRATPEDEGELPAIALIGLSEKPGELSEESPRRFTRTLSLIVETKIGDPSAEDASTRMNTIAEQIERIVLRDPLLPTSDGGEALANDVRWIGCDLTTDQGAAIFIGISTRFEIDYVYEPENVAPAHVRDFLSAHVSYTQAGQPATAVALEDDVDFPGP